MTLVLSIALILLIVLFAILCLLLVGAKQEATNTKQSVFELLRDVHDGFKSDEEFDIWVHEALDIANGKPSTKR